ncbi:MAG: NAD(P)H-hydrate dehydratase [Candidatus Margulisiibacteriota bacterium]
MDLQLPKRDSNAHKGSCGKLLVVAGSRGMTGAAMLTCKAALRTGAGLVRLVLPNSLVPFVDVELPEVITAGAAETPEGTLHTKAEGYILNPLAENDALAIGPGLSQNEKTQKLIASILRKCDKPAVIDADALAGIRDQGTGIRTSTPQRILTPHPGEMARLMETTVKDVQDHRDIIAKEAAHRFGAIVVLKGHQTVITDGEQMHINETGNPNMATAGMGDVLTGVISSLLAQGLTAWDAACTGVYLHGLAGDLASKEKGVGLIAGDVIEKLPAAIMASPQTPLR